MGSQETGVAGVQDPTGKAREDLRSNWRSADLAVAEKPPTWVRREELSQVPWKEFRKQFKRILGENIGIGSQALVSEFFEENERSRILQLLNSCNSCNSFLCVAPPSSSRATASCKRFAARPVRRARD